MGGESEVYGHFGSAPYFALCDIKTGIIEFIDNGGRAHEHGQCNPLGAIAGKSVSAILVGGIGARALERLNSGGIRVYRSPEGTLSAAMEQFKKGDVTEILPSDCCGGHGCH